MEGDSTALDDLDNAGNENWKKGGKIWLENPRNSFQQKKRCWNLQLLQKINPKYQIWYLFHLGICIFLCKIHSVVIHKSCLRFYKGTKNQNSWCRFQLPFKNFSFTLDLSEAEELLLLSLISFTLLPDIRESNVDLTSLLRFCKKIKNT